MLFLVFFYRWGPTGKSSQSTWTSSILLPMIWTWRLPTTTWRSRASTEKDRFLFCRLSVFCYYLFWRQTQFSEMIRSQIQNSTHKLTISTFKMWWSWIKTEEFQSSKQFFWKRDTMQTFPSSFLCYVSVPSTFKRLSKSKITREMLKWSIYILPYKYELFTLFQLLTLEERKQSDKCLCKMDSTKS